MGNARQVGPERVDVVRAGNRDVEQRHDRSPDIDERFVRGLTSRRVNQLDVRGQRHGDAHQAVLHEIRIVARILAVFAEVVRVHRPEQGIVGVRIAGAARQQSLESLPHRGRRQLEALRGHMAVGACASIASESFQVAVMERERAAHDRATWLTVAVQRPLVALGQRA